MVKKLYKHEFLAWLRILPLVYGITLVIAAMHRVLQIFESDSVYFVLVIIAASIMYGVALICCIGAPIVFGITRFYKNMFTGEGYLTMTLPVTPAQHLLVKLTTALVFSLLSGLVVLLSVAVITAGDILEEIILAAQYIIEHLPQQLSLHLGWWILEAAGALLVALAASYLLYYCCICIGQLAKKNRVLMAVGAYFGYYAISQVVSTASVILFVILDESDLLDGLYHFLFEDVYRLTHLSICLSLVFYAILGLAFYLISHRIISKKLNLE